MESQSLFLLINNVKLRMDVYIFQKEFILNLLELELKKS